MLVTVVDRGHGMLQMDNNDGTWSILFDDDSDSEGDYPLEQIALKEDEVMRIANAGGARVGNMQKPRKTLAAKPEGWTRFVCFSDTHGLHDQIPKAHCVSGDVLLHAGDFSNTGELHQVESLAKWLKAYPATHKIVIAGNHDVTFQPHFYEKAWQSFHSEPYDCEDVRRALIESGCCTYLEDGIAEVMGYRIYGSPWQPAFCDWAFNLQRGGPCMAAWDKIPSDVDILMTHGPAFGMRDTNSSGAPCGCADLLRAIRARAVPVAVCGHIHEGYGVSADRGTLFVNASTCTRSYKPSNPPIVFDLPPVAALREATEAMLAPLNCKQTLQEKTVSSAAQTAMECLV
jgi:Icc-related predicted phosphoesterase